AMPSLDLGQPVTLDSWVNRGDRLAGVKYRDALWDAVVDGEFRGEAGEVFYIRSVSGNTLHVAKQKSG
ncbi:MAG: NfeD family protein, partial [Burkholderiales bacterium]